MNRNDFQEGEQAYGYVKVDEPWDVFLTLFVYSTRAIAAQFLQDGWILVKIQWHKGKWEVVKFYDDRPVIRAIPDPWQVHKLESRGTWLDSIAPKALKVKDGN